MKKKDATQNKCSVKPTISYRIMCTLASDTTKENPDKIDGLVGIEGKPVREIDSNLNFARKDGYYAKR